MDVWESIEAFAGRLARFDRSFGELRGHADLEAIRQEWRYFYAAMGYTDVEISNLELHIAECLDKLTRVRATLAEGAGARDALEEIRHGRARLIGVATKSRSPIMVYAIPTLGDALYQVSETDNGSLDDCRPMSRRSLERNIRRGLLRTIQEDTPYGK